MIWSEQELANIALGGEKVAVERVLKHLDEDENAPIFMPENFSFLWGTLGVAGVSGTSESAREKIWYALKENGVVDAYDKGILGDFNHNLAQNFSDNRLRAWSKFDNYTASKKFKVLILKELFETNKKLEEETTPYYVDGVQLVAGLAKNGLSPRIKAFWEKIRHIEAKGETGKEVSDTYDKEAILRQVCDVIIYGNRSFNNQDKDYLFFYLREAINNGFNASVIRLDDRVLAKLVTQPENVEELSDIEKAAISARHAEVLEFASGFEEEKGFYEKTAVQIVRWDKNRLPALIERCMTLINVQDCPRGELFALELVNLGQFKSAVKILAALAQKGQATEMTCFLHRLLPYTKGAEQLLVDILKINMQKQRDREVFKNFPETAEYDARLYMQAARSFAENENYVCCASILELLVDGRWLDNLPMLSKEFMILGNLVLSKDSECVEKISKAAKKLGLKIFEDGDQVFIGQADDNPLSAMRRRLEQTIKDSTTIDVSGVLGKMSKAEASTYQAYQNIKDVLSFKKKSDKEPENEVLQSVEAVLENPESMPETVVSDEVVTEENPTVTVEEPNVVVAQPVVEEKVAEKQEVVVSANDDSKSSVKMKKIGEKFSSIKDKINVNNILGDKLNEVDKHFEKFKQVTSSAILKAEEQARKVKQKVADNAINIKNMAKTKSNETSAVGTPALTEEMIDKIMEPMDITKSENTEALVEMQQQLLGTFGGENAEAPENNIVMADNPPLEISENVGEMPTPDEETTPVAQENVGVDLSSLLSDPQAMVNNLTIGDGQEPIAPAPEPEPQSQPQPVIDSATLLSQQTAAIEQMFGSGELPSQRKEATPQPQPVIDSATLLSQQTAAIEQMFGSGELPSQKAAAEPNEPEKAAGTVQVDGVNKNMAEFEQNKANVNSILNVNPKEQDKYFDIIKRATTSSVQRARAEALKVKRKVGDANISGATSKVFDFAQKFNPFKK